jgi:methionyl-tRNA formyltransferase
LLSLPPYGCINIHASLLPKYRGAAPIQRCLMAGENETGITIIEMVLAMDAGPMIEKAAVAIAENMIFGELEQELRKAACQALDRALKAIAENRIIRVMQDEKQATFAAKLLSKEEKIEWDQPAATIHNLIRALSPSPGAWSSIYIGGQEKRLKIKRSLLRSDLVGQPGDILFLTKEALVVACGEGALQLLEVQLEGKKTLAISDFLRGLANATFSFVSSHH